MPAVAPSEFPPPFDSNDVIGPPTDAPEDRIEGGVAIVGGGPAGLACANKVLQLLENEPELTEKLGEVPVAVIEKGKVAGAHLLSGANMKPSAMEELFPDLPKEDWPVYQEVEKDAVYVLTKSKAFPLKPPPPGFKNHGNYVTSVAKLGRFLGEKAEEAGAYILSETAATKLLVEDRIVRGVRSGDRGRGKEGEELANFEPGSDVVAKATVLAEGTVGHLTYAAYDYFDMHGADPMRWELGVKEVWEVKEPLDRVIHTMGWPLRKSPKYNEFGGTFIYPMGEDKICIGLVVGLHRRDLQLPRRAAADQDPPLHRQADRGRQAGRLGREDDPLGRLLRDAEAARGARHDGCRRRGEHGQHPDPEGRPLRDARRHVRGGNHRRLAEAGHRLGQLRGLRREGPQVDDREGPEGIPQHAPALLQRLLRRWRDRLGDDDHQRQLPRRPLQAGARLRDRGRARQGL
jgi:flavin-dependent dehydrogenase